MEIKELKKLIDEKYGMRSFYKLVAADDEGEAEQFMDDTGLDFKYVEDYRSEGSGDYDAWSFIFEINGTPYEAQAGYSSEGGCDIGYMDDFWEVKEVTITVWKPV